MLSRLVFWLGFSLLGYHLFGYPILMWLLTRLFPRKRAETLEKPEPLPSVAVICAAYNEEAHIEAKIRSFLALDYPKDKIHLYVISDSSTDNTNQIVKCYLDYNVSLIIQSPRGGKQRAHNLIEPLLRTDYVLSTDANSIFEPDAVRRLVEVIHSDPAIGMASGELKLVSKDGKDSGEGLYWRYECMLKKLDSDFSSIICANGSLYIIRRNLFGQVNPGTVDDFERTLHVLSKRFRAVYVPGALVREEVTERAVEEVSRKVRIITREWIALKKYALLLNPFRFSNISFVLFSHKLIRWLFFLFLLMMLISSALINTPFYQWLFLLQAIFYFIGLIELILQKQNSHLPGAGLIAYVTAMGWSSLIAFVRFAFNINTGIWNPVRRPRNK